jgi:hypothetical protein
VEPRLRNAVGGGTVTLAAYRGVAFIHEFGEWVTENRAQRETFFKISLREARSYNCETRLLAS